MQKRENILKKLLKKMKQAVRSEFKKLPFLFGGHRDAAWPAAQLPQHKIGLIYKTVIQYDSF